MPVLVDADLPRLPDAVEETAYYVAAEGLANALKHADSATVKIRARVTQQRFCMEILDDGSGGAKSEGSGLLGLADRARALAGDLSVRSPAGCGTVIRLELPCA